MNKPPFSVTLNLFFILLNAMVWLGLGLIIALHLHPALPQDPTIQVVMALLSLGAAGFLFMLAFFLWKRLRLAWYAALGLLALTAVAAVFDDFGWIDLLVLAVILIPILLLIKDRAWYLRATPAAAGSSDPAKAP